VCKLIERGGDGALQKYRSHEDAMGFGIAEVRGSVMEGVVICSRPQRDPNPRPMNRVEDLLV
jgi:hypothetical protein